VVLQHRRGEVACGVDTWDWTTLTKEEDEERLLRLLVVKKNQLM
jgi:hypothetical protein